MSNEMIYFDSLAWCEFRHAMLSFNVSLKLILTLTAFLVSALAT